MLVVTALTISDSAGFDISALSLIDAAFVCGLAFGIHKKSRVCAVTMLVYFIISKAIQLIEMGGTTFMIPVALICLYYYWMGVVGTFGYHKHIRTQKNQAFADA